MDEGEKKPESGTISGIPQKKIVYAVLVVAVVILAVVLIAKFGFNADLLNPSGGQMALVQRSVIADRPIINPNITPSGPQSDLGVSVAPSVQIKPPGLVGRSPCTEEQMYCSGVCVNLTDPNNCGSCGKVCPGYPCAGPRCSSGKCSFTCSPGYGDCNQNTADGCETDLKNDSHNCGSCGRRCASGTYCSNGLQCVATGIPQQGGLSGSSSIHPDLSDFGAANATGCPE